MNPFNNVPDFVSDYVIACRDLLNLHDWTLTVRYVDIAENEQGNSSIGGRAECNARYHFAIVSFDRRNMPELHTEAKETIMHELLEVMISPFLLSIHRIIDLVPEELRDHALELMLDGKEPFVCKLAHAMVTNLQIIDTKSHNQAAQSDINIT